MKILRPYQQNAVNECWKALKVNDSPVLLMASVGAGKSLMLANILLTMQHAGKRALCLVNNAELVRNNCATFIDQGGDSSIYCAALGDKNATAPIVFGTPQSVLNGINKNEPIAKIKFNLIVVDEAHNINFNNHRTCFMQILRYYKQEYLPMRLLGATGTNFRFKGSEIVGEKCLFKTQVGNITTEQLIKENYLIEPKFHIDSNLIIDFSKVTIKKNGLFDQKQLEKVIEENTRLTALICQQVIHIMEEQNRFGVFFFATTKKHAEEIFSYLPCNESALILGDTPQHERTSILDKARTGAIRYLVNIAIISVGVDVPSYDTVAYLRPTESLVLLVQTMGRVLRLSPLTHKTEALVLDFAGNIERHRDWDNPVLLKAISQTIDKDKPLVIICPSCQEMNTVDARRCIGLHNSKRCDYYFEFKACPNAKCGIENDLAARHCRICKTEIIDPNEKLNLNGIIDQTKECQVLKASYAISEIKNGIKLRAVYKCQEKNGKIFGIIENYFSCSEKAKRVFYGQFVKQHCENPKKWYTTLDRKKNMELMLQEVKTPLNMKVINSKNGFIIKKKYFE